VKKPVVFVGSSRERLETARALKKRLEGSADVVVWDQAPFELNESIFDGLLKAADQADFAVFVFDTDDVTRIRHAEVRTPRDNVVFEFGLFTGRIGKGRTFWLGARASEALRIPTDLVGIIHLVFDPPVGQHASLYDALEAPAEQLRAQIEKLGRRKDRDMEELDDVKALCVASSEYDQPKFAQDIAMIRRSFPPGSVRDAHGIHALDFYNLFHEHWDIVHLAMFVDERGDLLFPDAGGQESNEKRVIRGDGFEEMVRKSQPLLVVIVTCDSLVLAARIARYTNTIAGHRPIDIRAALDWSTVFYPALADGCPLSEAFNTAQKLSDPGLVLLAKRDFRLSLPSVTARSPRDDQPGIHG